MWVPVWRDEMITFTDEARAKVKEYMDMAENGCQGVRVVVHPQGRHSFRYELSLVLEDEAYPSDVRVDQDLFTVFVDPESATRLEGTTVDFVSDLAGAGFKFDNPNAGARWDDPVAAKIQQVLDQKVTPAVASHGGWVDLLEVKGDAAIIEMGGGCQGCGMSHVTLKQGVEAAILQEVPEIKRVLDTTDHEAGENPYYARQ